MSPPRDPAAARVLVAGDNGEDVKPIRDALALEFAAVEVAVRAESAVADFDRFLPDVLVLAFDTLEKAQQHCLGLLRHSRAAHEQPHRTIVLCGRDEVRTVFQLCKKGHFDDYVLFWPQPHDGFRLTMAVWNAAHMLDLGKANGGVEDTQALARTVDRQLTAGMRHLSTAQDSLSKATVDPADAITPARLRQAVESAREHLRPMTAWAEGFRAEVAPQVAALRETAAPAGPRRLVLVVEDDSFSSKLIGKALEGQAFDLEFASSAHATLCLLRRVKPALILMDVNMPGMDGVALTQWLKASAANHEIPVVMLTGDSRRETIERSRVAGAAGFIVKPFSRENLLAKVIPFVS